MVTTMLFPLNDAVAMLSVPSRATSFIASAAFAPVLRSPSVDLLGRMLLYLGH